jgi:hypothetical protein
LALNDLLGGVLLIADVARRDGSRQGVHYWNLLPDGAEIDLTRQQFTDGEIIQPPRTLMRPAGLPKRCAEQYLTLRRRVGNALGILDNDGPTNM